MKNKIIDSLIAYIYDHDNFNIDYHQTHGTYSIKMSVIYQVINQYRYHRGVRKVDRLNNVRKLLIDNLQKIGITVLIGL